MALIKCPECGKEISDKALACPNCGNPLRESTSEQIIKEHEVNDNVNNEGVLCCPYCGSTQLHSEQKGFSGGKALAGAVAVGGIGLLAGTIGSKDVMVTCLKCGKKVKAGELKTKKQFIVDKEVEKNIKKSHEEWAKKNTGCVIAIWVIIIGLILFAITL